MTPKEELLGGEYGRIGVAFALGNSTVAYALIEATQSELLRSDDGGFSFKTVNRDNYKTIMHPNSRRIIMDKLNILVAPRTYTATISYGGETVSKSFEVKPDPRIKIDMDGLQENIALQRNLGDMLEKLWQLLKISEKRGKD
jgi:hypothetical protein